MSFIREQNAEPITGYRLIEPLGSGGFGEVWKCEAPGGLFKAIKFVYGNLNSLDSEGVRAEQELNALNRIKEVRHPFVLSLDRIESIEWEPYGDDSILYEFTDAQLLEQGWKPHTFNYPRELTYMDEAVMPTYHLLRGDLRSLKGGTGIETLSYF